MNPNRKSGKEMIFAVSDDPNEKRTKPRQVLAKLKGKAAWRNHHYREVPDPSIEPVPQRIEPVRVGPDERDALIAELQAKLAEATHNSTPAMPEKRKYTKKEKPQADASN